MKPRPPEILDTAEAAWRFLDREGGLDASFYDAPLIANLRTSLRLPADEPVADALARRAVTIEDFVAAFFEAIAPYAAMMTDLLNLFAQAGARRSDQNLRLDFDFGRDIKLGFDLRQFRDWLAVWERVRGATRVAEWDNNALWELNRALRVEWQEESGEQLMGAAGTAAEPWVREYLAGRWPQTVLSPPITGMTDLDRALYRAWHLWSTIIRECARISTDRQDLRRFRETAGAEDAEAGAGLLWTPRFLSMLDSDLWAASLAAGLYGTAARVRRLAPGPERDDFARDKSAALDDLFARQPVAVIEADSWAQNLRDFLNLPLWKQRHELYGAWVWSQIQAALHDIPCRIHQESGTIHFSFAGSHLATFPLLDPMLHVWAELRSPLAEKPWGMGRRQKIQPDYTLLHDPITSRDSAVLVVECKQYRAPSARNFIAALVDYARGRPAAVIVLVNYGPAPQTILEASPPDLRGRLVLIGDMRPGGTGVILFQMAVRGAALRGSAASDGPLVPDPGGPGAAPQPPAVKKISLTWSNRPQDLDLYLVAAADGTETTIYYGNMGSLSEPPWAELDRDARLGSGPETITLSRLAGRYSCYVHNFSGETALAGSGATILVVQGEGTLKLTCPREGNGRYWHVFDLDTKSGSIEIVNILTDSGPR